MFSSRKVANEQYYQTNAVTDSSVEGVKYISTTAAQTYPFKAFHKSYTQTLRLVFALVARLQSAPCETSRHDYLQSDEFHFARRAAADDMIISTQYEYITTCTSLHTRLQCCRLQAAAILHQYPEHSQGHEFRHIYYPLSIFYVDTVC